MAETRKHGYEGISDLPKGFEMTELGSIPEEWGIKRLEEAVAEIMSGDWGKGENASGLVACLVLRGTDFADAEKCNLSKVPIRYVKLSTVQKRHLKAGDLLVELSGGSKDQPTGRILLISDELLKKSKLPILYSNFTKRIRLTSDYVPEYYAFFWRHLYNLGATRIYEKRTTGIRNFKLNDFLRNESIPLPPLSEQRAIAHVLRTVQRAKEATERVIQATQELKKSLMRYLFTYGPVPMEEAERVPLKETEIGLVPEHWEVVRLREVAEYMKAGGTPKTSEASFWSGKIPFVKVEDVAKPGIYLIGTTSYITEQGLKNSNTWLVPKNSILLSMYGTAGEVKITGREVAISQNVLGIIPNENVFLVEFAYYALLWARNYTLHLITDVTIFKHFTLAKAKQLVLPLPPLHEQRAIARVLRTVDKKLQAEEARKQALEELFKTLLHNLMTGKIRVKDVVLPNVGEGKGDVTH